MNDIYNIMCLHPVTKLKIAQFQHNKNNNIIAIWFYVVLENKSAFIIRVQLQLPGSFSCVRICVSCLYKVCIYSPADCDTGWLQ